MKTILISILLSLLFTGLHAQSDNQTYGKVYYERVLNYDGTPSSRMFTLLFNSDFAVFYGEKSPPGDGISIKESNEDEFDLSFNLSLDRDRFIVLTDFAAGRVQSQVATLKDGRQQTFIVNEDIANLNWNIETEYKLIDKMKAQKATCEFRGRKYIAWFSGDIPVKYGPWKLHGLPGLILAVADEKNEVMFHAKSIRIPLDPELVSKEDYQFQGDAKEISLKEYLKIEDNIAAEFIKLITSKLPRGAKMELSDGSFNQIELDYEDEAIR